MEIVRYETARFPIGGVLTAVVSAPSPGWLAVENTRFPTGTDSSNKRINVKSPQVKNFEWNMQNIHDGVR